VEYRREIDGLRAIAVLPVIFFHAGFAAFSGGFIGVDVFFVISGYLITTIILSDMNKQQFSIVTFYERRARRILPALFFVMLCCLPFTWMWLTPKHIKDFTLSLKAVSSFSSNFLFWDESGYFSVASEWKPLLHTWSLAVEEQYYVLFPLFLMALWKLRKRWIFGALMAVGAISLIVAQWGAYHAPSATFFLLHARFWELAIGALIAFYFLYKSEHERFIKSRKKTSELGGFVGLLLICYSIYAFDKNTPFPSLYALLPTVGTGLIIIFATSETFVGRFLGIKPMVGIGLISYSIYLWHQPLFVFARHRSLTEPGTTLLLVLSAASILLAYISWRFVERPFRDKQIVTRKRIFTFAITGSLLFMTIGITWHHYQNKFFYRVLSVRGIDAINSARIKSPNARLWESNVVPNADNVFKTPADAPKYMFLVGDSHASALAEMLKNTVIKEVGTSDNIGFMAFTKNGCPPITQLYIEGDNKECYSHNENLFHYIASNDKIEYVVFCVRWTLFLADNLFDNHEGGIEFGTPLKYNVIDNNVADDSFDERKKLIAKNIVNSVDYLISIGKKVILVYPTPEAGWDVPEYITKYLLFNDIGLKNISPEVGSTSYNLFLDRNHYTYEVLDSITQNTNLYRVYPANIFCNTAVKDRCVVQDDSSIFYRDDDHLSYYGAKLVAEKIIEEINAPDGAHHLAQVKNN